MLKLSKSHDDMKDSLIPKLETKMQNVVSNLKHLLSGFNTGRASTSLIEPLKVEVYGSTMKLNQVSSVSIIDNRSLLVQVWDIANVKSVEKTILSMNVGLNTMVEDKNIRVNIPQLTQERRKEIIKKIADYTEKARIVVRNIRREGIEEIRKVQKEISKDAIHSHSNEIQKLTDLYIGNLDALLKNKSKEISG